MTRPARHERDSYIGQMGHRLIRVVPVAAVALLMFALLRLLRGGRSPAFEATTTAPVAWPELPPLPTFAGEVPGEPPAAPTGWVLPAADGTCPPDHPIKAKIASGIYHVPGGIFYERTHPDRCYVDGAAAEADGLRPARR